MTMWSRYRHACVNALVGLDGKYLSACAPSFHTILSFIIEGQPHFLLLCGGFS